MVQYLHFRILKFPLKPFFAINIYIYIIGISTNQNDPYGGFHKWGGTPLSLDGLFHGKSEKNKWMRTGGTPILGDLHIISHMITMFLGHNRPLSNYNFVYRLGTMVLTHNDSMGISQDVHNWAHHIVPITSWVSFLPALRSTLHKALPCLDSEIISDYHSRVYVIFSLYPNLHSYSVPITQCMH